MDETTNFAATALVLSDDVELVGEFRVAHGQSVGQTGDLLEDVIDVVLENWGHDMDIVLASVSATILPGDSAGVRR